VRVADARGAPRVASLAAPRPAEGAERFQTALNSALESGAVRSETPWRDAQSGRHGAITPLTASRNASGPLCRNYRRTSLGGQGQGGQGRGGQGRSVFIGRACRDAEGVWRIQRENPS
jgi:surface antigen